MNMFRTVKAAVSGLANCSGYPQLPLLPLDPMTQPEIRSRVVSSMIEFRSGDAVRDSFSYCLTDE